MKKPDILKPKDLYRELSPNILEDYICTIVHAHFKGRKFYMISQMFTGGEDEELYMLFDEEQTEKLMMKFQTHDPETFMYRLHKRFWNRYGRDVWYSFERFCNDKEIEYEVIIR